MIFRTRYNFIALSSVVLAGLSNSCYALATPDQVGDLSPKGRVAEGNDKKDSTIIKIIPDLPSANADATFLELGLMARRGTKFKEKISLC
ncbi:MAG: hypothetical protein LBB88_04660 [Planctomycetaceae bacterium]|nr:hypothetical protein [Planctomycetaceae bacterium]